MVPRLTLSSMARRASGDPGPRRKRTAHHPPTKFLADALVQRGGVPLAGCAGCAEIVCVAGRQAWLLVLAVAT
jgi:hypothetical protein